MQIPADVDVEGPGAEPSSVCAVSSRKPSNVHFFVLFPRVSLPTQSRSRRLAIAVRLSEIPDISVLMSVPQVLRW